MRCIELNNYGQGYNNLYAKGYTNIYGEDFVKLIKYLFKNTSYVSFRHQQSYVFFTKDICGNLHGVPNDKSDKEIWERMSPHLVKKANTLHWFLYGFTPENPGERYIYKTDKDIENILLELTDNILMKGTGHPYLPIEDMCFFADNKLVFGTVSHMSVCCAYESPAISLDYIETLGIWTEADYDELKSEQIILDI